MRAFAAAHEELTEACNNCDDVHEALFQPKGPNSAWVKRWFDEVLAATFYAANVGIAESSEMHVAPENASAFDIELRSDGVVTRIEVTVADLALHPNWRDKASHWQPGAQAAAIRRKLRRDGFVEPYNPVDGKTLDPLHEAHGETPENRLEACVNGLQFALDGKARGQGYGRGSTLLVYGREFPYFLRCGKRWSPADVVARVATPPDLEEFDAVFLVAAEPAWAIPIFGPGHSSSPIGNRDNLLRHSGRAERDPEPRGS